MSFVQFRASETPTELNESRLSSQTANLNIGNDQQFYKQEIELKKIYIEWYRLEIQLLQLRAQYAEVYINTLKREEKLKDVEMQYKTVHVNQGEQDTLMQNHIREVEERVQKEGLQTRKRGTLQAGPSVKKRRCG